jgi:hypothetical protein
MAENLEDIAWPMLEDAPTMTTVSISHEFMSTSLRNGKFL